MQQNADYVLIAYDGWAENGWGYGEINDVYGPFPGIKAAQKFGQDRGIRVSVAQRLTPALDA